MRFRVAVASVLVAAATFALFAPTLQHGFVNWDDDVYVTANPHLRPFTVERAGWILSHFYYYAYIPVTLLSHAADVAAWGLNPRGHHLTNVLLHAANALGIFLLGLLLLRAGPSRRSGIDGAALAGMTIAALLFALHPLRAESVSWISDRKDLLCAFFLIPALGAYLLDARAERGGRTWYAASLALFLLAALSKSIAVGFPLLLILLDRLWLERRPGRRLLLEKAPFLLVSAVLVFVSLGHAPDARRAYSVTGLGALESALFPLYALGFSLLKSVAPAGLSPIYPRVGVAGMAPALLLTLAVAAACVIAWRKGSPGPALAGASYFLFLLPNVAGLSSGMQPVADRYSYLATIGLFLLIGGALAAVWRRGGAGRVAALTLSALLLVTLASRTRAQSARWRSSIDLWESVVRSEPPRKDYVDGYLDLGAAYAEAGRAAEARAILERAVAIDPSHAGARYDLGVMQYAAGDRAAAAASFEAATRADPADPRSFYNLAIVQDELGRESEAVASMREAARLGSKDALEALRDMRAAR